MAVLAIEDSLSAGLLKDKVIFADTSFVVKLFRTQEQFHPLAKSFYQTHSNDDAAFCINVTVRHELLKCLREFLLLEALEKLHTPPEVLALTNFKKMSDVGKKLIAGGHLAFVKATLKGRLTKERKVAESLFLYEEGDPKKPLSWEDTATLMETYGLNSSDAMILNFALGRRYDAIVTFDGDYGYADNIPGFDVFMPRQRIPKP